MTASRIAADVRTKRLSAVEVTKAHLDRLAKVNPAINAVVQEFPEEALDDARQVDAAIARGDEPVQEDEAARLHRAVRRLWPEHADSVMRRAGEEAGRYMVEHLLPDRGRQLLARMPR